MQTQIAKLNGFSRFLLILGIFFGGLGFVGVAGAADANPNEMISSEAEILALKTALNKLGFYDNVIDASGGAMSLSLPIMKYQQASGTFPKSGLPGMPTQNVYQEILLAAQDIPDKTTSELDAEQAARDNAELQRFKEDCAERVAVGQSIECDCMAAEYRARREAAPEVHESTLNNNIYEKPIRACVNLEKVRANAKAQCLELVRPALRNMDSAEKRQDFCECAADLTVNQFETNTKRASTHMDWGSARAACEK